MEIERRIDQGELDASEQTGGTQPEGVAAEESASTPVARESKKIPWIPTGIIVYEIPPVIGKDPIGL